MRAILVIGLIFLLTGCGIAMPMMNSPSKFQQIELGQSRSDVITAIGKPTSIRGSTRLEDGSVLQVDEYRVYGDGSVTKAVVFCPITLTISCWIPPAGDKEPYWIQYVDGRLWKWGKAGDWQPDFTQDITIRQQ